MYIYIFLSLLKWSEIDGLIVFLNDLIKNPELYSLIGAIISFNSIIFGFGITAITFIGGFKELDIFKKYILPRNRRYAAFYIFYFYINIIGIVLCLITFVSVNIVIIGSIITLQVVQIILLFYQVYVLISFSFSSGDVGRKKSEPKSKK